MNPKASLLTIGDELLKGTVLNTNARFLAGELTDLGFSVAGQHSCPDSIEQIHQTLNFLWPASDLMILTGGLGPTPDDVTREAVSSFFHSPLVLSKRQYAFICNHYRQRKKPVPAIVRLEAMFPKAAVPLFNHYGIALGFYIKREGCLMIVLPGVPGELERMFSRLVRPLLQKEFPKLKKRFPLIVKMTGIGEPEVMKLLGKDFFDDPFDFGIYPQTGEVTLRLYAESSAIIHRLETKVRKRLKDFIYAEKESSLAEAAGELLWKRKATLSVAESCTGGRVCAEITKIPGSSRYFKGGVTAYADEIKTLFGGVPEKLLREKGAVSLEVAAALASGVRDKMKTDYGIGITGIAGPSGAVKGKPAGLVYIAIASKSKKHVWKEQFLGDREQVQTRAMKKALEHLWKTLL